MNAPVPHEPAVRTTCPYCGVGCGLIAKPDGRGGAAIVGDPTHPANFGRTCSKGWMPPMLRRLLVGARHAVDHRLGKGPSDELHRQG